MTPAETIAAAIEKLTQQRDAAMQGPWRGKVLDHWGSPTPGVWAEEAGDYVGYSMNQEDADLLVTMHATIDAQLAILGQSLAWHREWGSEKSAPGKDFDRRVLRLAQAILGEA